MKKLLLTAFTFLLLTASYAQNCTPTWPSGGGPGIIPDSATNLPVAYELLPYSATVNFKVPKDTIASLGGFPVAVTIQNITVVNVSGLSAIPASVPFTYVTNPATGIFQGDSVGCALITGTPAAGSSGTYPIQFSVIANAVINLTQNSVQQPYTIDYYKIVVLPDASARVIDGSVPAIVNLAPNPTKDITGLQYYVPAQQSTILMIYNSIGQVVQQTILNPSTGLNNYNIDTRELPNGTYFVKLIVGEKNMSTRFTVSK